MPTIDIFAPAGVFPDVHKLASGAAAAVMAIEQGRSTFQCPDKTSECSSVKCPRRLSPTLSGTAITSESRFSRMPAARLLTEATPGGWELSGHAPTNQEPVEVVRAEIAQLRSSGGARVNA
jgi:hypothetical protein